MKKVAKTQTGFTLIEVLVTVVVLAIGLLGVAGMQMTSTRFAKQSNLRYTAGLQANDMADRMRANPIGVTAGDYNGISGLGSKPGCAGSVAGCSPANMAQLDHFEWNRDNAAMLPGGAGTVTSVGGNTFDIIVTWNELDKNQATPIVKSQRLRVKV